MSFLYAEKRCDFNFTIIVLGNECNDLVSKSDDESDNDLPIRKRKGFQHK